MYINLLGPSEALIIKMNNSVNLIKGLFYTKLTFLIKKS